MSFIQKFELRLPVPQLNGLDQSLAGREIASGRPVTIHLLDRGMADENEYLLREISKLHSEYRVCFLETGNFQGTQYVVTDVLDGNPPIQSAGMTPREYALTSLTPITVGMVVSFKRAGTVKEIPSSISAGIDGLYHQVRFASQSELVQIKRLTQRVKPFLLFASIIPLSIDHFGRRRRLQTAGFRQFCSKALVLTGIVVRPLCKSTETIVQIPSQLFAEKSRWPIGERPRVSFAEK